MPIAISRSRTSDIAMMRTSSRLSRSTISGGVPAGARMLCHELTSKPG